MTLVGQRSMDGCSRSLQSGQLPWKIHYRLCGTLARPSSEQPPTGHQEGMQSCPQGAHIQGDTDPQAHRIDPEDRARQGVQGWEVVPGWTEWPGPKATLEASKSLGQDIPAERALETSRAGRAANAQGTSGHTEEWTLF